MAKKKRKKSQQKHQIQYASIFYVVLKNPDNTDKLNAFMLYVHWSVNKQKKKRNRLDYTSQPNEKYPR